MKVHEDTWIYISEKFGNMGYIKVYLEVLRYKAGINPTIPNFICFKTPLFSMVFG